MQIDGFDEIKQFVSTMIAQDCAAQRILVLKLIQGYTLEDVKTKELINHDKIMSDISPVIKKMANNLMAHGDFSVGNIVYNIRTDEWNLIDFGKANNLEKSIENKILSRQASAYKSTEELILDIFIIQKHSLVQPGHEIADI